MQGKEALAHVKQIREGHWEEHYLDDHLRKVAALAGEFATKFSSQSWGYLAGLWHDLGKYRPNFQHYIRTDSGYDPDAHVKSEHNPKTHHASTGAVYAIDTLGERGYLLAYLIAGHHAGLPDYYEGGTYGRALREIHQQDKSLLQEALGEQIPNDILKNDLPTLPMPLGGKEGLHLWLRMMFSCLVDADFLDTERFMSPDKSVQRQQESVTFGQLLSCFDDYMDILQQGTNNTDVNQVRSEILAACREKANGAPGVYTMTVPTGGGKTLSSLAFALEHACKHAKRRVIYAIPYTSIIEQTSNIFRKIFQSYPHVLIEHHSAMEPSREQDENHWSRLATENWDAPLVVTTTVQLFESLYAARTSRCRKLHNLVNSVIILDETQLLPSAQLKPIRHVIELLSKHYGVTFVMSTATPTGLQEQRDAFGKELLNGLPYESIVENPERYYRRLRRVQYTIPTNLHQEETWEDLAQKLMRCHSVLAIVNTRNDAQTLWKKMPKGTYHLSALMCPAHRTHVIHEIKQRLIHQQPTRVISTQLVEAGVDFDFPVVYRALAGLDSIVQSAGRCNREGKLKMGEVVIFIPPTVPPKGELATATQETISLLSGFEGTIDAPETFEQYFGSLFKAMKEFDQTQVLKTVQNVQIEKQRIQIQLRTAAKRFRMIDDQNSVPVYVRYGDGESLLRALAKDKPQRGLLRKLQRYTVNIYHYQFEQMRNRGDLEEVTSGFYAQSDHAIYSEATGLLIDTPELRAVDSVW